MLVGVPSIAAFSGGMTDMMTHQSNGFMYPFMEAAMLAEYIRRIFSSDELALEFSQAGRDTAHKRHDRSRIANKMVEVYGAISGFSK